MQQYYSRRLLGIHRLLDPENHTAHTLNYQLSWHLYTLLHSLQAIDTPSPKFIANLTQVFFSCSIFFVFFEIFFVLLPTLDEAFSVQKKLISVEFLQSIRVIGPMGVVRVCCVTLCT